MGYATLDSVHIAGICLLMLGVGVLTPILCYSLYQFYCISVISTDLIKYRNKSLVYYMNGLAILCFCVQRPYIIISEILHNGEESIAPAWFPFIVEYSFIFGFYTLFLIKTWLSFYSREYHRRLVESTWAQYVNPDSSPHDWIIKYKTKLGSPHFLMKVGFVVFIFEISIEIMVDIVIGKEVLIDHIIYLLSTLFVFIASFVLYFKTRDFNDIYHIKKEIQYQTLILLFILFINICAVTSVMIYEAPNTVIPTALVLLLSLGDITWFFISLISTAYPVYLHKRNINTLRIKNSQSSDKTDRHYLTQLLRIISDTDGFKSFMLHLIKEYSTESLLFLLELVQIKSEFQLSHGNVMKVPKTIDLTQLKIASAEKMTVNFNAHDVTDNPPSDMPDSESDTRQRSNSSKSQSRRLSFPERMTYLMHLNGGSVFCKIVLPLNLPQSAILESGSNDFGAQMTYLYNKYMKLNSQHQLNVSFEQRNGLKNLFESNLMDHIESECEMFNVMDDAAIEILNLLFNSFRRFKMTATYKEIKEKIKSNRNNTVSTDFNDDVIHSEDSYDKLSSLYLTNTCSSISLN